MILSGNSDAAQRGNLRGIAYDAKLERDVEHSFGVDQPTAILIPTGRTSDIERLAASKSSLLARRGYRSAPRERFKM